MCVNFYILQTEITTSSGRRVKRRNFDECDDSSHRIVENRKARNGRKWSKKKSSKASRPQRAAARNALTLFSKIKGCAPDQDEYNSEGDSSGSESMLEDSNFEDEESDKVVPDERAKNLKGKEVIVDESEDVPSSEEFPASREDAWNRKRLVLKFPVRDSNRGLFSGNPIPTSGNLTDLVGSSSSTSGGPVEVDGKDLMQLDVNKLYGNANLRDGYDRLGWLGGYGNGSMKWGGVRARTNKRIKLSEVPPLNASGSSSFSDNADSKSLIEERDVNGTLQETSQFGHEHLRNTDGLTDAKKVELSDSNKSLVSNGVQDEVHVATENGAPCLKSRDDNNGSTWLRNATEKIVSEPNNSSAIKSTPGERNRMSLLEQRSDAEELEKENHHHKAGLDGGDCNGAPKMVGVEEHASSLLLNSQAPHSQKKDRMYSAVYRRSRSFKAARTPSDGNGAHIGENTSNTSCQSLNRNVDTNGTMVDGINQSHSVELRDTTEELVNHERSVERSRRTENSSLNKFARRPREEWGSSMTVGLRSTRNRRINFVRDASPVDRRRSGQSLRKISWLMLSVPDCSRYIPQHGDEVVYLRQVMTW